MYEPKTPHWDHQATALDLCLDAPAYALFMEQRTGKSKVVIDKAAILFGRSEITALLVVAAPGRVHRNWVANEVPSHLPDRVPRTCHVWEANRIRYVAAERRFKGRDYDALKALLTVPGLAVLAVNEGAVTTDAFRRYLPKFMKARGSVLVAVDEFTLIMASASSQTTKMMWALGRNPAVRHRLILDGTPMESGPLDLYAPFAFLGRHIFGFDDNATFKAHFARWTTGMYRDKDGNLKEYPTIERGEDGLPLYQNMDEFQSKLSKYSFRVLRKDCWDVPEKVYQTHTFQLSPAQRSVYDALRDEYQAELAGAGTVTARHVLTRYMRLQQVASNFWPPERIAAVHEACSGNGCDLCEDLGVVVQKTKLRPIDPKVNPRLLALKDVLGLNPGPGIIWARFHEDVDAIMGLCRTLGYDPCQYDGRVPPALKDAAQDDFQAGRRFPLVGNPNSGGRGLKLSRALWIVNYSNGWSLLARLQSEDRAEEKGKLTGTGVIDLAAEDTVDDLSIVPALRAKKTIVDYVLNERGGAWL